VSATYASFTKRRVEDQAVVTLRYPGGAIGVVETGFLSRDPFTIELQGTRASLAYNSVANLLSMRSAGEDTWRPQPVYQDEPDPISRWVSHMREGTRADDNLARAVELSRLVSAANAAAASGTTLRYPADAA
jgi:1,5-anhydro-D-fructose reductase (1,5-anhydro-D-mannitol-forming)